MPTVRPLGERPRRVLGLRQIKVSSSGRVWWPCKAAPRAPWQQPLCLSWAWARPLAARGLASLHSDTWRPVFLF